MSVKDSYSVESIKVLQGLDAVRKRPGMYIGSTDAGGLHHLVWEILSNAVDEALAGYAKVITIVVYADGSVSVDDNGRGIPAEIHQESGKSGVELVFTELHAGGKFGAENGAYKTSGGLHGVGASVVNALADKVVVITRRHKKSYETVFEQGVTTVHTHPIGSAVSDGTFVRFWPSYKIFRGARLSFDRIKERSREAAFLISGLKILITNEATNVTETYESTSGITDFVSFIAEGKKTLTTPVAFVGKDLSSQIEVGIGFCYADDYSETTISFVNNVKTPDGGEHETGFRAGWTRVMNEYARAQDLIKAKDPNLEGEDIREGLVVIISLRVPENILEFVGQTKDRLRTIEARAAVESVVEQNLMSWLNANKREAHLIISKSIAAARARLAARKARNDERNLKKGLRDNKMLSGKLTPAQSRKPAERELFLVEGDSAGGSAKLGRDRRYQAILPLRGKVVNTERAKLVDVVSNEEIGAIISTIGANVGPNFGLLEAQYGKVIIMTDADTDGAHIQTLLLTFFFRHMRPLVEAGMVYIALPPLYKLSCGKAQASDDFYLWNDEELHETLATRKGCEVQRYKGLGEMNAEQLWETTMDPAHRTLIRVTIEDAAIAERRVSTLMGDNVEMRKNWISANVNFSSEDDFSVPKLG